MDHVHEQEINGRKYTFVTLPFNPGSKIYRKLHGYVAPVLGTVMEVLVPIVAQHRGKKPSELTLKDVAPALIQKGATKALAELVRHIGQLMADDEFAALIEQTFVGLSCNGQGVKPSHFAPDSCLMDYDQVVLWSVYFHHTRIFLEGLGFTNLEEKLASQLPNPSMLNLKPQGSSPEASPPQNV
jgi:hypothetical protein